MRLLPIVLAGLLVASCSKPAVDSRRYSDDVTEVALIKPVGGVENRKELAGAPAAAAEVEYAAAAAADAAAATPEASSAPRVPAGPPALAYTYSYGLSVAPRKLRETVARHEAACVSAGPAQCQVTGSSVSELGEDRVEGQLQLRAAPAWLKRFREGLAGDAEAAGGRLFQAEVTSEDLSRQIVDTEAALRAKITLRDRLQTLLATRPGKLADLLDVEREFARVQSEIDSTQSELAVMRGRVATSEVTLNYRSNTVLAPRGVWSPLARSLGNFLAIIATSLGSLVELIAWLAPWALIGGGLLWLLRKRLPKLRWPFRRKAPPPAV